MFHMKNNGSALLRESDTTFDNFPLGLSVLIVDLDQQSLQEMEAILRGSGFEVTKCVQVEDASTLLWKEGNVFHIIIIEQCLLGVNEFELLRIGREMDLPVIVIATSEDTQPNIVQWSLENGACDYLLKPIPMNVLKMVWKYMFLKKDNNVSRVNNQRMSWTPDSHQKFVESVRKLGGADNATPKKILQLLQSNFKGFEDVDREKISSHLQKYRDSLKKEVQPPMTTVKDTQGFQSVTLPFETIVPTIGDSTSCGNQSNVWMTQMDASSSEQMRNEFTGSQPFDWESILNVPDELFSLETFLDGIAENFNGDVSACEHFNGL